MPVDRATRRRITDKIFKAITKGVQDNGNFVFKKSQHVVPVKTGFLKKSGGYQPKKDGWILKYNAPYAAIVEEGSSGGKEYIPPHTRKAYTRKDGTRVKATQIAGYSVDTPEREGRQFLTRAAESELPDLPVNILRALEKHFKVRGNNTTAGKPSSSGGNPKSKSGGKPQTQGSKYKNKFGGKR